MNIDYQDQLNNPLDNLELILHFFLNFKIGNKNKFLNLKLSRIMFTSEFDF